VSERVHVLGLGDREPWEAATAGAGYPSLGWSYPWGLSASGIEPRLGIVDAQGARLLIPFVELHGDGFTDIATYQCMSGASLRPATIRPLLLWSEFARSQGWVTGYLQMSPYEGFRLDVPSARVLPRNEAFLVDTNPADFLARVSRTIRSKIQDAEGQGTQLVVGGDDVVEALQRLYPASMTRLQARRSYHFSPETLQRWARDPKSLVIAARVGPQIEAVCLIHCSGERAESPVFASTEAHRHLQAWLIWQALPLLAGQGVRAFNIGGADPNRPGLYAFKERFHAERRPTVAVGQIYDPARFAELCERAGRPAEDAFFPPYRA
jgi:hypothetical protein